MLESVVLQFFRETAPLEPGSTLLIAVSGGPDSVALLHALHALRDDLGVRIEVAHLDHGLRRESHEDAAFVDRLCASLGLTLHHQRVEVPRIHAREGGSLEALARRERYAFLEESAALAGAARIVTGHCAEDQAETMLLNLFRGAGPRGLGGMLPVGPGLLCRPLLEVRKGEILAWLRDREHAYREDASNLDPVHTRNRLRHRLLPLLRELLPADFEGVLLHEARLFAELDDFLTREGQTLLERCRRPAPPGSGEVHLDAAALLAPHPALARVAVRAALEETLGSLEGISHRHVEAILDLAGADHPSAGVDLPGDLRVRRDYGVLVLAPGESVPAPPPGRTLPRSSEGEITWGGVRVRWGTSVPTPTPVGPGGEMHESGIESPAAEVFDVNEVVPPLRIRGVREGDRVEPLGMEGSQKLSDLLVNRKVPRRMRAGIPVLCDNGGPHGGERILWVIGHRRSRHAALSEKTARVVRFEADWKDDPRIPR